MVRRRSGRIPHWLDALDPPARHPLLAAQSGLAMVVLLVPVLSFFHGADGLLGQSIPLFFIVPVVIAEIWGPEYGNDVQYLRVFINRLRRKIEDDPTHSTFIVNEPGVGYRLLPSP